MHNGLHNILMYKYFMYIFLSIGFRHNEERSDVVISLLEVTIMRLPRFTKAKLAMTNRD